MSEQQAKYAVSALDELINQAVYDYSSIHPKECADAEAELAALRKVVEAAKYVANNNPSGRGFSTLDRALVKFDRVVGK